jgi:acetyl-CoA carboxylase biotin carboxyl carrier protein
VDVGCQVRMGDAVGIMEVMKLMNNIKTIHKGVVQEIYVENESMVQFGQVLMYIESSDLR